MKVFSVSILLFGLLQIPVAASADGFVGDNFHEVEAHVFYRSAQLSAETLQDKINTYGIKTIINLRGANPGQDWFDQETLVAQKNGVEMVNIALSSESLPNRADLMTLLEAYASAPRPILVHCESGADRTGLASAVYVYDSSKGDKDAAEDMLSIKYFHIEWFHPAMDDFIENIYQGSVWATSSYQPCTENYKYFDKAASCTP